MTSLRSRLDVVATRNGGNIRRKLQNATSAADPKPPAGNAQLDNKIPTPTPTAATAKPAPQPTPLSNLNFPSASPSPYVDVEPGYYPTTSGNSIPFYPTNSYPTFPSNGYPSYPIYPSNSYPSYPSNTYPSYPSNTYPTYNEEDDSMPTGYIALVVFAFVVGGLFSMYQLVSKRTVTPARTRPTHGNAMPVNGSTSTARPATVAVAVAARRPLPPRTPAQQEKVDLVKSMTRDQRREYVANFLRAEKYAEQGRADSNRSGNFIVSQSTRTLQNGADSAAADRAGANASVSANANTVVAAPNCAICLEAFADGEDICLSQNKHCSHQFHVICAFDWLLNSQECPCCRRDYLSIDQPPSHRGDNMIPQEHDDTVWADEDALPSRSQENNADIVAVEISVLATVDDDATSTVATVEAVERIPQEQVEAVVRGTTLAANATGSTSSQPLSTILATASSTTAVNRARALTPQEIL